MCPSRITRGSKNSGCKRLRTAHAPEAIRQTIEVFANGFGGDAFEMTLPHPLQLAHLDDRSNHFDRCADLVVIARLDLSHDRSNRDRDFDECGGDGR
jgi:hypothetical protein